MNDAAKWWYYVRQNGGSYYPQTVANLGYNVWDWDASKLATLYQDSAKTTPVASNSDPVGAWVDGVQGVDAIQATTANKPTYTTASLNGLPTLSFDGGDLLATGDISISTFAVWVVFKASVVAASNLVYEQGGASDGFFLDLFDDPSYSIRINAARGGLRSLRNVTDAGVYTSFTLWRHESNLTSTSHNLYKNGVLLTAVSSITNDPGATTVIQPFNIGARSGVSVPMTGNIAHLCIVSPYPTAAIIANMESYINGIWGIY